MLIPRKLLGLVYVAIGIFLAADRGYLDDIDTLKRILSAILAVFLWPLLLLGIELRIS